MIYCPHSKACIVTDESALGFTYTQCETAGDSAQKAEPKVCHRVWDFVPVAGCPMRGDGNGGGSCASIQSYFTTASLPFDISDDYMGILRLTTTASESPFLGPNIRKLPSLPGSASLV